MAERELPSDSEESDEDYVPSGEENQLSEEESDGDVEDGKVSGGEGGGDETQTKRKRAGKKQSSGKRKRAKHSSPVPEVDEEEKIEEIAKTEEEKKKKADDIWAAFKKDTDDTSKSTPSQLTSPSTSESVSENRTKVEPEKVATVTKLFEFAGEKVEVTEKVPVAQPSKGIRGRPVFGAGAPRGGGGLAGALNQLGKKNKLSVLEKSKLDWQGYKTQHQLEEEIQTHNRGKNGYLEKQDFLQRTDLRQFELEKQMRATVKRSNR